jgi:hypothetical protein
MGYLYHLMGTCGMFIDNVTISCGTFTMYSNSLASFVLDDVYNVQMALTCPGGHLHCLVGHFIMSRQMCVMQRNRNTMEHNPGGVRATGHVHEKDS